VANFANSIFSRDDARAQGRRRLVVTQGSPATVRPVLRRAADRGMSIPRQSLVAHLLGGQNGAGELARGLGSVTTAVLGQSVSSGCLSANGSNAPVRDAGRDSKISGGL
jgi:hypothetical protein